VDFAPEKVKVTKNLKLIIQIARESSLLMETKREVSSLARILTLLISEKMAKKTVKILRSKWEVIRPTEK
jgi:hypothetical protein